MASQTPQKIFRIERRLGENRAGASPAAPAALGGTGVDDAAFAEIRELIRAIDVKVSALPKLEEIEERLVKDVLDMQGRIKDTKEEIAALRHPKVKDDKIQRASLQLDAIVEQTEQATSRILESAERLEEQISHIRDTHANDQIVANSTDLMIDAITQIYEASNFQDITGQRTRKVVDVLKYIEERLGRMVHLWGVGEIEAMPVPSDDIDRRDDTLALTGPKLAGASSHAEAISQDDIDALFN
ncbi:MAG: protein phosphatase CheZ [Alphaproteobacteria bacterium]